MTDIAPSDGLTPVAPLPTPPTPSAARPAASAARPMPRAPGAAAAALTPGPWPARSGHAQTADRAESALDGRRRGELSRRDEILERASEMFAEHGYHGASLRKIAAHAGVSHSGMLHHFSTKDDLLGAVIDRLEEHAQMILDGLGAPCAGPVEFERALATWWDPRSPLIRLLATLNAEAVSRDHPGRFRLARLRCVHEHALEQCFLALQERGMLWEEIDPAFAGRSMLALILNHAGREGTVRSMQHRDHGDAPLSDLHRLLETYLQPAEGPAPHGTAPHGAAPPLRPGGAATR